MVSRARDGAAAHEYLDCRACQRRFPIVNSIPRFAGDLGDLSATASSYGYQWSGFWSGLFDRGDVFGLQFEQTSDYFLRSLGLDRGDLNGKVVLDAGTGSGRVPLSIHAMGCSIYAVDMHSSLETVAARLSSHPSVQVVQANLIALPFPDDFFDIAWSSGVLMYSQDAGEVFRSIARKVKPGGRLFISVYGKDINHYRMFRHLLPFAHRLPVPFVYFLSALIAVPLYTGFNLALWAIRTFKRGQPPPYRVGAFTVEDASHKSYRSIVLNLFDQLHPQFQSEHSVEEVRSWFSSNGFADVVFTETIGMVAARGVKKA